LLATPVKLKKMLTYVLKTQINESNVEFFIKIYTLNLIY